jgi:nucleoside-diphosphate-sugar epimerase
MKILVTGATGYIGQKLMSRLINAGHHVNALCRTQPEGALFNNPRVTVFEGELSDKEKIREAMHGCEQVYHIAAYARVWAKDPSRFYDVNVQGTVNVLEAALHQQVKKLVFTSTGATFGVSNGQPLEEAHVRMMDFFNEYESSKFMAEEKVLYYVNKGLPAVIVHPVRVYGPGIMNESNAVSRMIKMYLDGDWHVIPGNGEALGCFSYIDDVVDGHLLAMERGKSGEKYILGGENVSFNQFFTLLKNLTGKKYMLVKVPLPFMMLYGWQEEMMAKWFTREPMITRKWIKKYSYHSAFSSEKAVCQLGYRITPLEEGLSKTLEWLLTENNFVELNHLA